MQGCVCLFVKVHICKHVFEPLCPHKICDYITSATDREPISPWGLLAPIAMHVFNCNVPTQLFVWQIKIRYRQLTVNLQTYSCESATVSPVYFVLMVVKTFNFNNLTAVSKNVHQGLVSIKVFLSTVNQFLLKSLSRRPTSKKQNHKLSWVSELLLYILYTAV